MGGRDGTVSAAMTHDPDDEGIRSNGRPPPAARTDEARLGEARPPGEQPAEPSPAEVGRPDVRGIDLRGIDGRATDPPGTDPRGIDGRATDPPGTDPRGTDPRGTDPRGTDPRATGERPPGGADAGTATRGVQVAARTVQVVTGGLIAVYVASTILRHHPSTIPLYDGWVGNLAYFGCAGLCALRVVAVRDRQRAGWAAMTFALLLFALGNLVWTTAVQFMDPVPYPSAQDALFLPFYPIAYLGIVLLVRNRLPAWGSRAIWLDGIIAALGVAALEAAIVIAAVSRYSTGDTGDVATNLAYSIGAVVLTTILVGVFAVQGWRTDRLWWVLGAGLVMFAFADSVYMIQALTDDYVTGTPLDSVWMVGTFLMASAAWLGGGARHEPARSTQPVFIPGLFIVTSLSIVVYATWHRVLPLAVILATCTLLVAVARMGNAYRQLQTLAESKREARTDELTGLPNRRLFYETLRRRLEAGAGEEQLAVLMIDLDRFKEINDSLGHHVGDEVLRQLGPRLASVVADSGTVARLGGDEFGLLLVPLPDPTVATEVAERICDDLRRSFLLDTMTLHVDASIGIAIAPEHGVVADALLQRADIAMYEAKRSRRSWEVYSSIRDTHTRDRLELMEDVRGAIDRRELVLHYQPKVDLATRTVTGVEALVRWQHPERGLLAPDRFLGLFEQSGLMGPLAMDVLNQAVTQQARWASQNLDLSVAVNLSAANLADAELPERVAEVLRRRGVSAGSIVLEITEDSLMVDADQGLDVLERLFALGVELSVDDYGTGFSSLAYLRDLPVHELKLDRAFLAAASHDDRAVAIIRSTIDLAHSLDLRIVAEGVETDENLALIAGMGCDIAQGFLLGRPSPASLLFQVPGETEAATVP
ncbi:MAG: diguanylate cyclase [Actinomycetota bacterium]|nr:diguanylate cyclase [Actinomycetota bacterium]